MSWIGSLLKTASVSVVFCVLASGIAHIVSAQVSRDLYLIAIGDHLLPGAPLESMILGPLFIGAYVSWWFGLAAAPIVFVIAGGLRLNWTLGRITRAFATSFVASAVAWVGATTFVGSCDGWTNALLGAVLDYGYVILAIGMGAMGLSMRIQANAIRSSALPTES